MEKIDETKTQFFEKINKIDKLLARLTKKGKYKLSI